MSIDKKKFIQNFRSFSVSAFIGAGLTYVGFAIIKESKELHPEIFKTIPSKNVDNKIDSAKDTAMHISLHSNTPKP